MVSENVYTYLARSDRREREDDEDWVYHPVDLNVMKDRERYVLPDAKRED